MLVCVCTPTTWIQSILTLASTEFARHRKTRQYPHMRHQQWLFQSTDSLVGNVKSQFHRRPRETRWKNLWRANSQIQNGNARWVWSVLPGIKCPTWFYFSGQRLQFFYFLFFHCIPSSKCAWSSERFQRSRTNNAVMIISRQIYKENEIPNIFTENLTCQIPSSLCGDHKALHAS